MSGPSSRHVVVVGAGVGGLAAAIDLAVHGWRVTVLERASAPGGKMREIEVGGRGIDAGPTVFTMRWVFDELFQHAGTRLDDALTLTKAETLARHAWDGSMLDLFADKKRSADAIGRFAGAKDAAGYLSFCNEAARMYRTLEEPFIKSPRPTANELVRATGVFRALRLKPFATMWSAIAAQMRDPRLRQLFGRYATYCGTSPFLAPATLMLVAHVEQEGVWLIEGGMHRLAVAMAALAASHGATLRYDTPVKEIVISDTKVKGVRLEDGDLIPCDAVVMNGEPNAIATGLLGGKASEAAAQVKFPGRSLSAVTWAGMVRTEGMNLLRHNVFFSGNYKAEFELINTGMLPTEPTIYICAQDRPAYDAPAHDAPAYDAPTYDAPAIAPSPEGSERVLMLVNAPPNGDRRAFTQVEIDQCMQGMASLLQRCGLFMQFTEPAVMTGPAQFHRLFPASGGMLYGPAVGAGFATFKRPENRTKVAGLYLAGGSTHPGAGVPMATLSGRRAAAEVIEDLTPKPPPVLTRLFRKGATPGGTSTR